MECSKLYVVLMQDGDGPIPADENPWPDPSNPDDEIFDISAHYYAIYALPVPDVDVDVDGSSPAPPPEKKLKPSSLLQPLATLSLRDFPSHMTFACVGSSIYMFGGWPGTMRSSRPPRSAHRTFLPDFSTRPIYPSLDLYILDTTLLTDPSITLPLQLHPHHCRRGPSLNTLKDSSYSVSLLGKIFVIPDRFEYSHEECAEFLDPSTDPNRWHCIPNPEFVSTLVNTCNVLGSYIFAVTCDGPVYELDATDPHQGWKESTRLRYLQFASAPVVAVADGLLCAWLPVHRLPGNICFVACSLDNDSTPSSGLDIIYVCHPSGQRMGGDIIHGERYVLDIGDGRVAIFTSGFTSAQPLEFHLVLDIVRLEKRERHDTGAYGTKEWTPRVKINPLKSIDRKIEKIDTKYVNICGCFPMMRGAGAPSSVACATPPVAWYNDLVVRCRIFKRWDTAESPFIVFD